MASNVFHEGERAVQARAGVTALADRIGQSIRRELPPAARTFLAERRWLVLGALDGAGRPWPSIRAGAPGFAHAIDERTVRIAADPAADALDEGRLRAGSLAGLIALDPATRRRLRFNGRVLANDRGGVILEADQVFSNCPKYIQRRDERPADGAGASATVVAATERLSEQQRERVQAADTFFIATARPGEGVDVSHRGGMPGFVQVAGQRLWWPDYGGNAMFTTLGNLHVHPQAGLLVPQFESGGALVLIGRAAIDWEAASAAPLTGAERIVTMEIERVVELDGVLPVGFQLREYSPFNPR